MAYIGNPPTIGQWRKLDDISGSFNGSTTTFTTAVGGSNVTAGSANQLIVSLGGVIQQPNVDYSVTTNSIIFTTAPASGLDFFAVLAGDALNAAVPADGTITTAKLAGNLTVDLDSGSAAAPSLTFDSNTGLYSPAGDEVSVATGGTERLRIDSTGQIGAVSLGTASAPVFSFTGDTNTGIYSPGADQVALTTGGTGRVFIDSSGRVGLGTSSPGFQLDLKGAANSTFLHTQDSTGTYKAIYGVDSDGAVQGAVFGALSNHNLVFRTNNTERARIDTAGRLGVGTTSPEELMHLNASSSGSLVDLLKIDNGGGATGTEAGIVFECGTDRTARISSANTGSDLGALKFWTAGSVDTLTERARIDSSGRLLVGTSSSPSVGDGQYARIVVQGYTGGATAQGYVALARGEAASSITAGEEIGTIAFTDSSGYSFAYIGCSADAAAGANDYPGRLTFSTTLDGQSSPTERMRIPNGGGLSVGSTVNPNALTQTSGIRLGSSTIANHDFTNITTSPVTIANGVGIGGLAFVQAFNTSNGAQYVGLVMWRSGVTAVISESNALGFGLTYSVSGSTLRLQTASGTISGSVITLAG